MSFFGYRKDSAPKQTQETHQSEVERLRGRQLASLVRAGARAKNHQQTMFEVLIAETSRGKVNLIICLPDSFPLKAPTAQVSMLIQHPWVDVNGNVKGHQDLNRWTAHSDIGRIVGEIVQELKRVISSAVSASSSQNSQNQQYGNLPYNNATASSYNQYPTPQGYQQQPQYQQQQYHHQQQQQHQYQSPYQQSQPQTSATTATSRNAESEKPKQEQRSIPHTKIPIIPAVFPELEELSLSQLETLNNDRHAFKSFIKKMDSVKKFSALREEVMNGNVEIAQKTLKLQPKLQDLQVQVQEMRASLRQKQEELATKQTRQQKVVAKFHAEALLDKVSASAKEDDTISDDIAHKFTNGESNVTQFIAEYIPLRKRYHERTIKFNKLLQVG